MYISGSPSLNPIHLLKRRSRQNLPFPLDSPRKTCFYVARNGIYHMMRLLEANGSGIVLAPDYHHGNEIIAMKAAGVKLRYYPVKKNLDVDIDAIKNLCDVEPRPRVLYVTHFIGWPQPMNEIRRLCQDRNLILVEDCALSFMSEFEGKPLGTFGAYAVFCLYKTLPVPNGGVLVANDNPIPAGLAAHSCAASSVTGPMSELVLRWIRTQYEIPGRALFAMKRVTGRLLTALRIRRMPVGNSGFDLSAVNIGMSPICHRLLPRLRYDWIKTVRRRNFAILTERLTGYIPLLEKDLAPGVCPLFFPLLVKDKKGAAGALAGRGIETIEFWNHGDPESYSCGSHAEFLRRHVLEIPIHQDVTAEAAEYTAQQILQLGLGLA